MCLLTVELMFMSDMNTRFKCGIHKEIVTCHSLSDKAPRNPSNYLSAECDGNLKAKQKLCQHMESP